MVEPQNELASSQGRKNRIQAVLETIEEEEPIELRELLGRIGVDLGLTKSTAEEYIEQLRDAGKIDLEDEGEGLNLSKDATVTIADDD